MNLQSEADQILRAAAARTARRERAGPEVPQPPKARAHSKRHSVNRERSQEQRAKALTQKKKIEGNDAEAARRKNVVRRYWSGQLADLSSL